MDQPDSTNTTENWFAFYVKPRHEKRVKERLETAGFEVFCPLIKMKVRWSDRWKKVQKPALPGYIFVRTGEAGRREVLQDDSVFNSVFWNKKPAVVRHEEIRAMAHLLEMAEVVEEGPPPAFLPGDQVRVQHGHLAGFDGVVVSVQNRTVKMRIGSIESDFIVQVPAGKVELV